MKPRIEKKLSKRLAVIFNGLCIGRSVWIDREFERDRHYAWPDKPLTPAQVRHNQQNRVAVNHVPSVGGEYCSYAGDCSDHFTLYQWLYDRERCDVFYDPEFDDMNFDDPDAPKSPEEAARIEALWEKARRRWRRRRQVPHLMERAREMARLEYAQSSAWVKDARLLCPQTFPFIDRKEAAK